MKPIRHIVLGRFAPIHNGHQLLITAMLEKYGSENCGIIIGSSNLSINPRTPFSFDARKKFVITLFPKVRLFDIEDIEEDLQVQRIETLEIWQANLKYMEESCGETWIFCGGSDDDLRDMKKDFSTEIIINRSIEGNQVSGTFVRKMLAEKNYREIENLVPPMVYDDIVKEYKKNSELF